MQEIELLPSSERDNQYITSSFGGTTEKVLRNFENNYIKQDGQIVAGIVAASTMDTLEVEFLLWRKSSRAGAGTAAAGAGQNLARQDGCKRGAAGAPAFRLRPPANGLRAAGPAEPLL